MSFGVTAHKCQGLTAQTIIVSTKNMFAEGQAFVAFSRVTSLNGLHLIDFDPTKIFCDVAALEEYNRLRQTINLPPIALPAVRGGRKRGSGRAKKQQPPPTLTVRFFYQFSFFIADFCRLSHQQQQERGEDAELLQPTMKLHRKEFHVWRPMMRHELRLLWLCHLVLRLLNHRIPLESEREDYLSFNSSTSQIHAS
jgi:hypothetical protein